MLVDNKHYLSFFHTQVTQCITSFFVLTLPLTSTFVFTHISTHLLCRRVFQIVVTPHPLHLLIIPFLRSPSPYLPSFTLVVTLTLASSLLCRRVCRVVIKSLISSVPISSPLPHPSYFGQSGRLHFITTLHHVTPLLHLSFTHPSHPIPSLRASGNQVDSVSLSYCLAALLIIQSFVFVHHRDTSPYFYN